MLTFCAILSSNAIGYWGELNVLQNPADPAKIELAFSNFITWLLLVIFQHGSCVLSFGLVSISDVIRIATMFPTKPNGKADQVRKASTRCSAEGFRKLDQSRLNGSTLIRRMK